MPQDLFLKSFSDLMGLKPYLKNKILAVERGLVMDLDPILGKRGGRKKVMSGTHCHFMLKKQG